MYCYSIANSRRNGGKNKSGNPKTSDLMERLIGKNRLGRYVLVSVGIVFVLTTLISCGYDDNKLPLSKTDMSGSAVAEKMPEKAQELAAGESIVNATLQKRSKYILSPYSRESLDKVRKRLEAKQNTPVETFTYKVSRGDTLWSVSKRYRVDVDDLARDNGLTVNDSLSIGKELRISKAPVTVDYTVQSGDSLWKISRKFGVTISGIASLNGIGTETQLQRGQILKVKTFDESVKL
ncbi:MAG: hypothetical protein CVV64_00180 [Candidatus Wallbacteria bacterium HGW-Wallbacteria-1]|jgi:LysM repeat protein|uniref:LysM domain-containing protein n=1 Tax=Candidatus Wallbacteria bacterium HGW-Wallbacteria-1 TaxID=2013854 RepID=A0A2N1PU69_9BACT|nr:MAG: hypothetical protein CVV64_00180 [Candidatus Wallbacteria bacterium HGW-Wallbacteria-1]